jgi:perosamine synthetase
MKLIPLSNPDITDCERQAVLDVLLTPNLSLGPKIPEFESILAEYNQVPYAVAVSSGTAALHLIIRSLSIGAGDYVITTPFSFVSTANCVLFEGASPLFVDIEPTTYNLHPQQVEDFYLGLPAEKKARVKAVLFVDVFGVPAWGQQFEKLAEKYNLFLINDAAEALGAKINQRKCGSFGDAGVLAFYPNKQITTAEGGVLLTRHEKIRDLACSMRNQGRDKGNSWLQHARLGYNYRLNDMQAALGIAQMSRVEEILQKRRQVKQNYDNCLAELFSKGTLIKQQCPADALASPFVYVVRLADRFSQTDRDTMLGYLRSKNIQCSNYFSPIHLQPVYQELGYKSGDFPLTEKISERTMALPFFNNLPLDDIYFVVETVSNYLTKL